MKNFIITTLFIFLFINGGSATKLNDFHSKTERNSYRLVHSYIISASRNKTSVNASVYYMPVDQSDIAQANIRAKLPAKIEFNGVEMEKGVLKNEPSEFLFCADMKEKTDPAKLDKPTSTVNPTSDEMPQPKSQEFDYHIVLNEFRTDNTVTITNPENESETFQIKINPLRLKNPDDVEVTRARDTIIRLDGNRSNDRFDFQFLLSQKNGDFQDENAAQFDSVANTIKFPAKSLKNYKRGEALFGLYSSDSISIKTGENTGFSIFLTYKEEVCAQVVD